MRPRNSEREKYVANKQARYLGMDPKDVLGMIDRKGGDYYRSDLYPDQSVISQAEDDYSTFRTGTDAMNTIANDMRSYYGVSSQPRKVMTNLPPEVEAQVAAVSEPYVRPQPRPQPQQESVSQQEPPQMRERIMGGLRKAGEAIRGFDDAYSAKIRDMYEGANPTVKAIGYTVGGGYPSLRRGEVEREIGPETRRQQVQRQAMEYALPIANAVPKYVLPAAGITLAGQGLIELARGFGDQQSAGTIEM